MEWKRLYNGSGYIITDPNSGSGAYMISGGLNGGAVIDTGTTALLGAVGLVGMILVTAAIFNVISFALFILIAVVMALLISAMIAQIYDNPDLCKDILQNGMGVVLGLSGVALGTAALGTAALASLLSGFITGLTLSQVDRRHTLFSVCYA